MSQPSLPNPLLEECFVSLPLLLCTPTRRGQRDVPAVKFGLRDLQAAKSVGSCWETAGKLWDVPRGPVVGTTQGLCNEPISHHGLTGFIPGSVSWCRGCTGGICAAPQRLEGSPHCPCSMSVAGAWCRQVGWWQAQLLWALPPALLLAVWVLLPEGHWASRSYCPFSCRAFEQLSTTHKRTRCSGEK